MTNLDSLLILDEQSIMNYKKPTAYTIKYEQWLYDIGTIDLKGRVATPSLALGASKTQQPLAAYFIQFVNDSFYQD